MTCKMREFQDLVLAWVLRIFPCFLDKRHVLWPIYLLWGGRRTVDDDKLSNIDELAEKRRGFTFSDIFNKKTYTKGKTSEGAVNLGGQLRPHHQNNVLP